MFSGQILQTVFLVVTTGLMHGLFLVPVVLGALPHAWTGGSQGAYETGEQMIEIRENGDQQLNGKKHETEKIQRTNDDAIAHIDDDCNEFTPL